MLVRNNLKTFVKSESGAVTVDWVVLTALVVLLAVAVVATIRPATEALAHRIQHALGAIHPEA